jgi:hypothetical protein
MIYPPETRLGHHRRYSPERAWAPLSNDEWAVLSPFVFRAAEAEAEAALAVDAAAAAAAAGVPARRRPGRPVRDPRARLDAIFWLAAHTKAGRAPSASASPTPICPNGSSDASKRSFPAASAPCRPAFSAPHGA